MITGSKLPRASGTAAFTVMSYRGQGTLARRVLTAFARFDCAAIRSLHGFGSRETLRRCAAEHLER
jgi:hypothetical protein